MRAAGLLLLLTGCDLLSDGKGDDSGAALDTEEVGAMVGMTEAHNAVRREKGAGDLAWDPEVAVVAQGWADKLALSGCGLTHSIGDYGENLYATSVTGVATPDDVVGAWAAEEAWYDYTTNTCAAPSGASCGHYTQVVWADSTRLGCGIANCASGWEVWVCNYDPPGNWVGEWPY